MHGVHKLEPAAACQKVCIDYPATVEETVEVSKFCKEVKTLTESLVEIQYGEQGKDPAMHKTQESELADPANRGSDQRLEVKNPNDTILIGLQHDYRVELLLTAAMVSRAQEKRD